MQHELRLAVLLAIEKPATWVDRGHPGQQEHGRGQVREDA